MEEYIQSLLQYFGIYSDDITNIIIHVIQILSMGLLGWIAYIIAKKWLARIVNHIAGKTTTQWDDLMFDQRFFNRLGLFIAPVTIEIATSHIGWEYMDIITRFINVWIVISILLLISSILDGINRIYESYPISKNRPIKVFIQVIKIFFYCMAIIIIISILIAKSPVALLAGLGAFAAILMLVFKDTILGFVAGVQLIANHMVNIGDWIVMPSNNADGEVQEINLTTVKVQNWDKTISTIPTYKLVSESFTNWRGMQESGGRRIKRSVNIDIYSIHYLSEKEIATLKKSALLKEYIETKIEELKAYNDNRTTETILDERRLTNIGTFREYMESWISANPDINLEMTHMVRQLQPTPTGIPLEIYCFSKQQQWIPYERVQSDLFDHLFAILPLFNLKVFQYPTNMEWMQQK